MNRLKTLCLIVIFITPATSFAEEFQGSLLWGQRLILSFPVTGVIKQLDVQAGSKVNQGQMLAALDKSPFDSRLKKAESGIARIEPMLFDAQQDYEQSLELFDRTVLSEVELQKTEVRLKGLQAEQAIARADLELVAWQHKQSRLIAPFDAIVLFSNLIQGMVVSEENQSELRIELAKEGIMHVLLKLKAESVSNVSMNQQAKVTIGKDSYDASVKRIAMLPDTNGLFSVQVEFNYPANRRYIEQQAARVVF